MADVSVNVLNNIKHRGVVCFLTCFWSGHLSLRKVSTSKSISASFVHLFWKDLIYPELSRWMHQETHYDLIRFADWQKHSFEFFPPSGTSPLFRRLVFTDRKLIKTTFLHMFESFDWSYSAAKFSPQAFHLPSGLLLLLCGRIFVEYIAEAQTTLLVILILRFIFIHADGGLAAGYV